MFNNPFKVGTKRPSERGDTAWKAGSRFPVGVRVILYFTVSRLALGSTEER
jgi:hypothetical protein